MVQSENYLVAINCPVCCGNNCQKSFSIFHNQSTVLELLQLNNRNEAVDIVACNLCNHRYMNPVINQELINRYYSVLNSEYYHNSKNHNQTQNNNFKEYKEYGKIIKTLKNAGRVLEIGCGNGYLLKTLENLGYDCYGVEPSPMASDHAKNRLGLKVENKFLAESSFYNQKFDVIILMDVVEHIIYMHNFMREITAILNEGGIIFIGTGNINSLNAKIAGPNWGYFLSWEHVSFFNEESMQYLLQKNNFENIQIRKTSYHYKRIQNFWEFFIKNMIKKLVNPFLKSKYYHGIAYDHFIVTATYNKH